MPARRRRARPVRAGRRRRGRLSMSACPWTVPGSVVRTNDTRTRVRLRHISGVLSQTTPTTDTRARILHATLRVIAAGGIGAVSNRRVATEAGVALGSLTYHFPSQTALLRDSLLLYADEE